jgi:hypothetical protein
MTRYCLGFAIASSPAEPKSPQNCVKKSRPNFPLTIEIFTLTFHYSIAEASNEQREDDPPAHVGKLQQRGRNSILGRQGTFCTYL